MTTTAQKETVSTENEPIPGYEMWCEKCYYESVERFCKGFTITHNRKSFPPSIVPKLPPGMALSVRRARDLIIVQRKGEPSQAASHPRHAGAQR